MQTSQLNKQLKPTLNYFQISLLDKPVIKISQLTV